RTAEPVAGHVGGLLRLRHRSGPRRAGDRRPGERGAAAGLARVAALRRPRVPGGRPGPCPPLRVRAPPDRPRLLRRGERGRHRPDPALGSGPVPLHVTDPDDPRLRDFVGLTDVRLRRTLEPAGGLYIAEGEKVIRRALAAGHRPRAFLIAERWLADLVGDAEAEGVPV